MKRMGQGREESREMERAGNSREDFRWKVSEEIREARTMGKWKE